MSTHIFFQPLGKGTDLYMARPETLLHTYLYIPVASSTIQEFLEALCLECTEALPQQFPALGRKHLLTPAEQSELEGLEARHHVPPVPDICPRLA